MQKAKGRCSFLLPWQLFTAVYSCAVLSLAEQGQRVAFWLLPSCKVINSGCWPSDLLTGDVPPNAFPRTSRPQIPFKTNPQTYFQKYLEGEEAVPRQTPCWFFSVRYVNKMAFWCKETWTREYFDTAEIIPWSWSHVSFCSNEGSSLFVPVHQQHDWQAIKF